MELKLSISDAGLTDARQTADCLMQYCLSDISADAPDSLQQLSGLPLLVAQDFRTIPFEMHAQGQGEARFAVQVFFLTRNGDTSLC